MRYLKNLHNKYAVIKVVDIKDRTRSDKVDELTFEFWILTNISKAEDRTDGGERRGEPEIRERADETEAKRGAEQPHPEGEQRAGDAGGAKRRAEEEAQRPARRSGPLEPGMVFRDKNEPWCPEMVVLPPGEFMMGSTEAEREWAIKEGAVREWVEPEKPQHLVRIAYALAVGRYPVTFEEYGHFARTTGRAQPKDEGWGRGRRPVINVDWQDAKAFADWLSAQTRRRYRLLSEAEWEYACRGGTNTRYAWGDEITPKNADYYVSNVGKTSEVGKFPVHPFGLCDMHGNVREWVEDCWNVSYEGAPDDGSAWTTGDCNRRVLRGGSWYSHAANLRSARRYWHEVGIRDKLSGFRVARTLSQSARDTP